MEIWIYQKHLAFYSNGVLKSWAILLGWIESDTIQRKWNETDYTYLLELSYECTQAIQIPKTATILLKGAQKLQNTIYYYSTIRSYCL